MSHSKPVTDFDQLKPGQVVAITDHRNDQTYQFTIVAVRDDDVLMKGHKTVYRHPVSRLAIALSADERHRAITRYSVRIISEPPAA